MTLTVEPLERVPEIRAGDDLAEIIVAALGVGEALREGDVLVIAHKIVSKAEGRIRALSEVQPQARALELAAELEDNHIPSLSAWLRQRSRLDRNAKLASVAST